MESKRALESRVPRSHDEFSDLSQMGNKVEGMRNVAKSRPDGQTLVNFSNAIT